ncbi:helix-turn-helix domain-containing protein [Levilactobacillus hammesii]|uniref:HTH cro/C1-type domain-containing protein n=1 Tax=Levilactobacillus hammesii DSM 16381 TaxID=1423753 RepID=A0A0R1URZ0_9LACO|nr:helix-turn-helix transcriptional regulator [Levilactobacillus hammesii]KRL95540.1 hypothetical protein FD28_GL002509 [Levilactobacillus hammesii DSM 16381]
MTTLVERIKSTAKNKYGWNLKTTAQNAGIGINSIYRWKTQAPTSKSLQKVADVLNVSVDFLLTGNEEEQSIKKTDDNSATGVIAAHIDDDTPAEEQQQIINFIENLKKARGGQD